MKTEGNTILITGGATGIGLALAEAFLTKGNKIIICGRRTDKLLEIKHKYPDIHFRPCDVTKEDERKELYHWAVLAFPNLNILVNNAGIQRPVDFKKGDSDFHEAEQEIITNLTAPVHLSALFIPHLMKQKESAVINVSSGLGFIPIAFMPVYCATKAALHSFSISLRHQLRDTTVKVFEIIPPTVDTELDHGRRGTTNRGINPEIVATASLKSIEKNEYEIAVGEAENLMTGSKKNFEQTFARMNGR
ncbi:MAG: SDR family oxidoreductase [Ignavibacteria bacterium]|jgi:uncharacterized oxidoreductase